MTFEYTIVQTDELDGGNVLGHPTFYDTLPEARDAVAQAIRMFKGEYEVAHIGNATWMFRKWNKRGRLIEHWELTIALDS